MPIWASHPKPKEGELLSSWLVRLAAAGGMTAIEFCESTLSIKKPNLRLIDRSPEDHLLEAISEGTGVPVDRIRGTSLSTEDGYVFSQTGKGETFWLVPALTVNSKINRFTIGMPFCPTCLDTDEIPYYRKHWHYAFHPICSIHQTPLRNECPHCNRPYSHMQPVARREVDLTMPIRSCWSCSSNVGAITPTPLWGGVLLELTLSIQNNMLNGIHEGGFDMPSFGHVNSRFYLDTMHSILNSLTIGNNASDRMKYIGDIMGINYSAHRALPKLFERHNIEHKQAENRAILLCLANWLMEEWPTRLVAYSEKFKLNLRSLFSSIDTSYWLATTLISSLQPRATDARSNEEVENATRLLRTCVKRPVSPSEIKEFMTMGSLGDHTEKRIIYRATVLAWHKKFSAEWEKERKTQKARRLAKIITWSRSKKCMEKLKTSSLLHF